MLYDFFATTPITMESILIHELKDLGAEKITPTVSGASFQGTLETAYRICLWSRTANRVLLKLASFTVHSQEDLYQSIYKINWFEHMKPDASFAVTFNAKNSQCIKNTHFGALRVKDAIVDQMRVKFNKRPNIDTERPDLRINVYLEKNNAQLSLDLSGESLHRRGYRDQSHPAPIKENLAAALLYKANWPEIAARQGTFIDPMCGSGTFLLEAAMMASDYAPGLLSSYQGFLGWKKHKPELWQQLLDEAEKRKSTGITKLPRIVGYDHNQRSIQSALQHIQNAGLSHTIHVERKSLQDCQPATSWPKGLLMCNPPYGQRLSDSEQVAELYKQFGEILKTNFIGWYAALLISDKELGFRLGIRSEKPVKFFNGPIECKLLRFDIKESAFFIPKPVNREEKLQVIGHSDEDNVGIEMFVNRVTKNLKKLSKWAKRNKITCYRVYDADLPEFAVAVDVYFADQIWVNVQEYQAPKNVDAAKADLRLAAILRAIPAIFAIPAQQISLKIRSKQKSIDQYEKLANSRSFHIIEEEGCRLSVNFTDYLDTGLFLDHRPIRKIIQQQAKNKHFLNLFCYTASASVHAAVGRAKSTTSIDMSKTYLAWAQRNFDINGIRGEHRFIQANCIDWLKSATKNARPKQYDIIFLDPPTFSNSKRMDSNFDIQKDYIFLLNQSAKLLSPDGVLYFSTNFRRFKMDNEIFPHLTIEDITASTIPEDFSRNSKIHYCWRIQKQ